MMLRTLFFRMCWARLRASSRSAHSSNSALSTGEWLSKSWAALQHAARVSLISNASLAVRPMGKAGERLVDFTPSLSTREAGFETW